MWVAGLDLARQLCRPLGTLVLKSTCAAGANFNTAPFVVDELKVHYIVHYIMHSIVHFIVYYIVHYIEQHVEERACHAQEPQPQVHTLRSQP